MVFFFSPSIKGTQKLEGSMGLSDVKFAYSR